MGLSKQIVFDSAVPALGDTIAAYVFGTNRIASAAVGGNESLYTIAALHDGAGNSLTSTAGALNVNVASFTGEIAVEGDVADDAADAGNPLKVGSKATQLLTTVSEGDRANLNSDLYRRARMTNASNVGALVTRAPVGVAAAAIVTPLPGRQRFLAQNRGSKNIWVGFDNTVTADNAATGGMLIPAHTGTMDLELGDNVTLWAISDTAAQFLFVYEDA